MHGFVTNIERDSLDNQSFRKVLYTDARLQLVVMSLKPGEEIGEEVHGVDQFIRVEQGAGTAILSGKEYAIEDGTVVVVPGGTTHNIKNGEAGEMKLYTLYAPPEHKDGAEHRTKKDAEAAESEDHFDGTTTE
jgi:mannose-6-phosphate isomerase-like protein (cupin superfamily)